MGRKVAVLCVLALAVLSYTQSVSASCAIYCPPPLVMIGCRCEWLYPTAIVRAAAVDCPPECDIACKYGKVLDERGCPTCKCNPPPRGGGIPERPQVPYKAV